MNHNIHPKRDRINLRVASHVKAKLERAAAFSGQAVSQFIINAALNSAEETIQQHDVLHLNEQDSEVFLQALAKPIVFNDDLIAALEEHSKRVISK